MVTILSCYRAVNEVFLVLQKGISRLYLSHIMINMAEYFFIKKFQKERATVNKFSKRLSCMFFTFEDHKRGPSFYVEI